MADDLAAAYQGLLGSIRVSNYLDVAAAAIMLYDHIITLDLEVELVWKRRWSAVNLLFIANRVLGDLNALGLLVEASNLSRLSSCMGVGIATIVPESLQYINWAIFSALRVYAVGGQKWFTTSLVFLLSIVPLVTNVYSDATSMFLEAQFTDTLSICTGGSSVAPEVGTILSYVTRGALVAADVVVIVVTFLSTFGTKREGDALNMKTELSTMLMRDGSLYFIAMVILNVASMATSGATDFNVNLVSVVSAVSTIIVARFLLNLRDVARRPASAPGTSTALSIGVATPQVSVSGMHFAARVVGSMGAELGTTFGIGMEGLKIHELAEDDDESMASPHGLNELEMKEGIVEPVLKGEHGDIRPCEEVIGHGVEAC